MKSYKIFAIGVVMLLGMASCDNYFDLALDQNKETKDAFIDVQDVKNGMIGAYYSLGTYRFLGMNVPAIGDMASDLAVASASSGHYVNINQYTISDTQQELEQVWEYGYKVVDACTRTIKGAQDVLSRGKDLKMSADDSTKVRSYISQCYALRALSTFVLTNLYGLPYQAGTDNAQLGISLLDKNPLEPFVKTKRFSVKECYDQVLSDIKQAEEYYEGTGEMNGSPQFYFNDAAIAALKARVELFMGKYENAAADAQKAIDLRNSGDVSNESYVKMWSSIAITDEDIFTISKSDNDNLSANALNTLYGSYKGTLSNVLKAKFGKNDIRAQVLRVTAYKFQGTSTSQAVSNIPIFRKSEMYLIIAECQARLNQQEKAREALLYTAKRNTDIATVDNLPQDTSELLDFIFEERARELYQEGHRWFDARRMGRTLDVKNGGFKNFDVAKFVFPIPAAEVNAGFGVIQTTGWEDNLPK